jgi:hypothetical protein
MLNYVKKINKHPLKATLIQKSLETKQRSCRSFYVTESGAGWFRFEPPNVFNGLQILRPVSLTLLLQTEQHLIRQSPPTTLPFSPPTRALVAFPQLNCKTCHDGSKLFQSGASYFNL